MNKRKIYRILALLIASALAAAGAAGCGESEKAAVSVSETVQSAYESKQKDSTAAVSPDTEGKDKEETVYVSTAADGSVDSVSVEALLRVRDDGEIVDLSTLDNIKNTEGDEEYEAGSEGELIWQNHGENIKYKGDADQELPVGVKITYKLDGEEISADELAGKSGRVTIRFDYFNNTSRKVKVRKSLPDKLEFHEDSDDIDMDDIDIPEEEVEIGTVVPFAAISMIVLPEGFSNIETDNAKIAEFSGQKVAVGYGFPGLGGALDTDSLTGTDEDDKIDIPEYSEISADVTDFSLDFITVIFTNGMLEDLDVEEFDDIDQIAAGTALLDKAAEALADGGDELCDGAEEFRDYLEEYTSGVDSIKSGTSQLSSALSQLNSQKKTLYDGAAAISDGLAQLDKSLQAVDMSGTDKIDASGFTSAVQGFAADAAGLNEALSAVMGQIVQAQMYTQNVNAAREALDGVDVNISTEGLPEEAAAVIEAARAAKGSLDAAAMPENIDLSAVTEISTDMMNQIQTIGAFLETLSGYMTQLSGLSESVTQLKSAVSALATGSASLTEGISTLNTAIEQLASGAATLDSGVGTMQSYGPELLDGMDEFADGCGELRDALKSFREDGTAEFADKAGDKLTSFTARLRALKAADDMYYNYSGIADGASGSVRFIFETEEIK